MTPATAGLGKHLLRLCTVGFLGCAKPTPATPPDPTLAHVGVWHGTGMAFPDGELCLVFCPNTRFFAADTKCEDTAHEDFQRDWTWARQKDGLLLAIRAEGQAMPMQFRPSGPADALFDLPAHPALPMTRIDLLSPVCLR